MNLLKTLIGIYFNLLAHIFPKLGGKQSFYFFCMPFKAKIKANQQEWLNTGIQKSLRVEGKKVLSYAWGTGPQLVFFMHGWQSNSYRWKKYIEKLDKSKFTLVTIDAPGHGNSDGRYSNVPLIEKALKAVMDEYGIPSSIIAHSVGAFSTIYFLHKNNISIDRFVSLATPGDAAQFISFIQSELKLSNKATALLIDYFTNYAGRSPGQFSIENFAPSIRVKSLIVHDRSDKVTSSENSKKLHSLMKNSELILTSGLNHRLQEEEIINKACDFINF